MSNRSQQQAARALADATPGLKYTTALRQVRGGSGPLPADGNPQFDFDCVDANPGRIPFGTDTHGRPVFMDPRENMNVMVAGVTGAGKSVAAQALVYGFAVEGAELYVIDPVKGGADFEFVRPYATAFATDIFKAAGLAEHINAEVVRRKNLNAKHGVASISDLPAQLRPPMLVVMIDEFTSLTGPLTVPPKSVDLEMERDREHVIAENLARGQIGSSAGKLAREARSAGVVLLLGSQKMTATMLDKIPNGSDLKTNLARVLLGAASQPERMSAFRNPEQAALLGTDVPKGRGIWESLTEDGIAIRVWFATQKELSSELLKRRGLPNLSRQVDLSQWDSPEDGATVTMTLEEYTKLVGAADTESIPAKLKAKLAKKLLTGQSQAFMERLFAHNNLTNKSLTNEHGRTRPTPSPVRPFLQLGDVVDFYAGAKHQWTVANQSENFTILTDDDDGNPIYTIIDWRNGWRGPHSSWGFGTTTDEERVVALAALESDELELSIRRALYVDIKTVRRDGTLTIRRAKEMAEPVPLQLGTLEDETLSAPSASSLEALFAGNSRVNKTLWNSGERTPLTVSPVGPFLEIGDALTYYGYATWQWTVVNQNENFTILSRLDEDGSLVSSVIDWRNGWRTHSDWSLERNSEGDRIADVEALESGEMAVGGSHDWHLDIETVRRKGKLVIRRAKKPAEAANDHRPEDTL